MSKRITMSHILIIVLLIVPVIAVLLLLDYTHKKQKRKEENLYLNYLREVSGKEGIVPGFQKQLVKQLLVFDEGSQQLLVIHRKADGCEHTLHRVEDIRSVQLHRINGSVQIENGKTENFTVQTGLKILADQQPETFLVFYDHETHNIYLKSELEREAARVQNRIAETFGTHIKMS